SAGIGQCQIPESFRIIARAQRETHTHIIDAVSDEDLGDRCAADAILDQIGDIGDIYAVAGCCRTVGLDYYLRERRLLKDRCLPGDPDIAENVDDLTGDPAIFDKIVSHDSQDQRTVSAANQVEHHVADRLVDANVDTGQLAQACIQLAHEVRLSL